MTDVQDMISKLQQAANITGLEGLSDESGSFIRVSPSNAGNTGERKIHTACRACIANCGVIATVRNGRVVKLQGDPADRMSKGSLCAKGLAGIQALYHHP
jgi:anaerobic selenocysteine-containing dehydrogenase